jgi:branched-chain amino acid transport system ATP-binding protein
MLSANGIRKSFGKTSILRGVNLSVDRGEISSIIGPNGAGKTTFFNILSGYLKPDQGNVYFLETDVTGKTPHLLCKLGMVKSFQITNIFPRLTTFENVQISVMSRRKKLKNMWVNAEIIYEVLEILENVGLSQKRFDKAGLLSHGDQRRLEIGIALGSSPSLLLLDEPTAGMGPEESLMILEMILELKNKSDLTVLFIEHDISIVFQFSEKIYVMYNGTIFAQGTPEEIRMNAEVQRIYLCEEDS